MMDKKSANGLASQAVEGAGQRKQLPYSVETPYGFHLDLDFLKYVDDIEKGNTIKRVHIQRRARGPKFSTLPRNFSLPGHGARPPPKDTWSGTSTLGSKPKSRVTEVQQIFDFKPSNGGTSSQIRAPAPGGSYAVARPKEEARAGVRPFEEQPLVLQARPNLLRTSSMPASVPLRKGSDSGDERSGGSQNGSSESVFRPADVLDRRVPQDRTGLHQQITVALRRVRELEEQVRTIPELKAQICSLREEREKLLLRLQAQTQTQVQAQAQAASPGPASDSQPREAAAPESTSTEDVSKRPPSAEDPSSSIAQPDAGKLLTQPSDGQREENSLEATAGTLSGGGAVQGTTVRSENPTSAEGENTVTVEMSSDEDLASIQQLQAKLTNLEAKLSLASDDLDRTNVLLKEQVEENRLKEERILLLSEGAGETAPPEARRGRRESVDRETETEKVDLANQETETESAGTVDKGTDMAMIEVCIPQERHQGTETERLDTQQQLMDVDGREGRHRANSVDQGTETERVDTADQVTETQAPARVDQVTETETNSPGLHPVRPRANSMEQGTVTERVNTVDQVTETEGVTREDRQTETVMERQDRQTNHPGGSVEFGGMVTGTFLTESVVMESVGMENVEMENVGMENVVMENVVMENVEMENVGMENVVMENVEMENVVAENAFEKMDNLVTDVVLTESSAPDQSAVAEIEVNKITITDAEVEESVVRENVLVQTVVEDHNIVMETVVDEQNMAVEVEETEVVIGGPSESSRSAREALESVAPVNVALESVILVTKVEDVTLESAAPENVTTQRKVPESESRENKVLENVTIESEVQESETIENKVPENVAPETEAPVVEATTRTATELSAPKRPPRHIPASAQTAQTPERSLVQPPAKLKAQPEASIETSSSQPPPRASNEASSPSQPPPRASNEASSSSQPPPRASNEASSSSQPPPRASNEASSPSQPPPRASIEASSPSQPPPRASIEASSPSQPLPRASIEASSPSQPPPRASIEASSTQPPRRGSSEATQPRRGSGESPTSPAALGQVVTRLTGLLNEQWAQLGSGGQQGATQLQQQQDGTGGQKAAAKPAAKAAGKTADKPAGKSGPSKMSSIQNQLVSSLSALSAFYSPGQKAAASKQQGLKSIMKKNEGAGKQGGAKKNLKFVGVNGGYESTSSEESSGEDKEQEEEEVQEEVQDEEEEDSSDPEDQEPAEEHQDQAQTEQETTQKEVSDPGAQGGGGEAEGQEEPLDPETSKAEQATGVTVDKDFMEACLYIRDHMTAVSSPDKEMRKVLLVLYQEWFRVSSQKDSQAHIVTLYLREVGVATPTLLRYIVNLTDGNGNTALHYSVSHGNFPVVKLLLDTGLCEVDTQNKAGYTAVMLACLTAAEASEDMEVALQLLRQGDVNARAGQSGQTALMLAVSHGRMAMVRLLLTCPVDVNIQDHSGSTALMCASEHGHTDITRLLLEAGLCHTGLTDKNEQTALSLALQASHGEIVDLLRAHSDASTSDPPATTAPL